MKRSSLILITLSSLLLLSACKGSKSGSSASSAGPSLTGSGKSSCLVGRWPDSSLPLNLKMSSAFTGDFTGADYDVFTHNSLEQMAKVWNVGATRGLLTVPFAATGTTGYSATTSFRDSEMGIYKSYTWFSNVSSSALAITQFYGIVTNSAGLGDYIELTHADIIVNYKDYAPKLTMPNNPLKEFDVPTIILHEMGHLLGLCHESKQLSVMQPYYLSTQRSLQTFDRDIIQDLYVDSAIAHMEVSKKNAISSKSEESNLPPVGTEVSGVIELRANGECIHKVNGKEIYKHITKLK